MNRRNFLTSMLAACAAPAIVRADSLMRIVPRETLLAGFSTAPATRLMQSQIPHDVVFFNNRIWISSASTGSFSEILRPSLEKAFAGAYQNQRIAA